MSALEVFVCFGAAMFVATACKEPDASPSPVTASASIATSASPAASAATPETPWFVGAWSAAFRTEPHRVELDRKQGAPREWGEDKKPRCAGDVKLSVDVDAAGVATGSGSGALGNVRVQGTVEGDALKARVTPMDADAFHGSLVAQRKDGALVGELRSSSNDSFELCKAAVTLARKP